MAQVQQDVSTIFQSFLQIQLDTFKNAVNSVNSIQLQWQQSMSSSMFFNNLFEQALMFGFSDRDIFKKLNFIARIHHQFCNLKYIFYIQLHELLHLTLKYGNSFPQCFTLIYKTVLLNLISKKITMTEDMLQQNINIIEKII